MKKEQKTRSEEYWKEINNTYNNKNRKRLAKSTKTSMNRRQEKIKTTLRRS